MYRVFCESFQNYISQYGQKIQQGGYRSIITRPMKLLCNTQSYFAEKYLQSDIYKQLSDLLAYIEMNTDRYPMFKAFSWALESRGIRGEYFGITPLKDLEEQAKLLRMFLDLSYWDESEIAVSFI